MRTHAHGYFPEKGGYDAYVRRVFHQIDRRLCNLSELLKAYNPKEYEGEEEVIQQSLATNLAFVEGIQELFHSAYLKKRRL